MGGPDVAAVLGSGLGFAGASAEAVTKTVRVVRVGVTVIVVRRCVRIVEKDDDDGLGIDEDEDNRGVKGSKECVVVRTDGGVSVSTDGIAEAVVGFGASVIMIVIFCSPVDEPDDVART